MIKVYLHVGMPKCASSSLQSFFKNNYQNNCLNGLCYPASFRETTGYHSHRPLHKIPLEEIPKAVEEIELEAKRAGCDKILISSEKFTNSLWDREVTGKVVTALNSRFGTENTNILILLRNHFEFAESVYAQYLKGGMFRTQDKKFFRNNNKGDLNQFASNFRKNNGFDFYCYKSFIEKFKVNAPFNKLNVFSTERADCGGIDIIEYMCGYFNIPYFKQALKENARYSDVALHLLHYSRIKFGLSKTKKHRENISALFPRGEKTLSKLLHVHGDLYMDIMKTSIGDRSYLEPIMQGPCAALFSKPAPYEEKQLTTREVVIPDWYFYFIDRLIDKDSASLSSAKKLLAAARANS